jgi:hypothetical protein
MTNPAPEANIVVLNNGTIVTFEKEMTHEAEVARSDKMYEGVMLEPDGEGSFKTKGLPFANYVKATEVTLPYLITKIEVGGTVIEYTDAWLKKLTQRDYKLLKVHVDKMIAEAGGAIMEGKKNG